MQPSCRGKYFHQYCQGFRSRSPLSPLARTQIIWRLPRAKLAFPHISRLRRCASGEHACYVYYKCSITSRSESMAASTSSSGPVVKRPQISSTDTTSMSERRRFVPAWKSEFPWVILVEGAMRCQYCQDSGKSRKPASRIFPRAHAHAEKYGWLARLGMQKNTF